MTDKERAEKRADGFRVLSRRHIESYLFDDGILKRLCESLGQAVKIDDVLAAKQEALKASQANGHPADDMKSASGRLFTSLQKILGVQGKKSNAFMRDVLAPLITADTTVYKSLKQDVFA